MANVTAGLFRSERKASGGWRLVKVSETSRLRRLAEGNFYAMWHAGSSRKSEALGNDPDAALTALKRRRAILAAAATGVEVVVETETTTVKAAVAEYLERCRDRAGRDGYGMAQSSISAYEYRLGYLLEFDGTTPLTEVDDQYVRRFLRFLRDHDNDLSDRTCYNVMQSVNSFLHKQGIAAAGSVLTEMSYKDKECRPYTQDELTRFFAACSPTEKLIFKFFLLSGCREQEVANTEVRDLLFASNVLHITPKPNRNFRLKGKRNGKGRKVPMPSAFMAQLQQHSKDMQPTDLLFPAVGGGVEGHFLRLCQRIAYLAGLNGFELHRFRKTHATQHHESGVSVRKIQAWLGHESLDVTLAYLGVEDAADEASQEQVNNSKLAVYA